MAKKGTDHKNLMNRVNRISGQLKGIATMIEEQKYCIDILTQIKASRSALKSLELEILENHLNHCVKDVISSGSKRKSNEKMREIMDLLRKSSKN